MAPWPPRPPVEASRKSMNKVHVFQCLHIYICGYANMPFVYIVSSNPPITQQFSTEGGCAISGFLSDFCDMTTSACGKESLHCTNVLLAISTRGNRLQGR